MIDYQNLNIEIAKVVETELASRLEPLLFKSMIKSTNLDVSRLDLDLKMFVRIAFNPGMAEIKKFELNNIIHLSNPGSNFLMPGLVVYSCGGSGNIAPSALTIKAAAASEILLCSLSLFDDIQDKDKKLSLQAKFGNEVCLDVALILIELSQGMFCEVSEQLFSEALANPIVRVDVDYLRLLHTFCFQPLRYSFQRIASAARGQLLDIQEGKIALETRLNDHQYYLAKASLKSALIVSSLTEFGAILGLAQTLINNELSGDPAQIFIDLNKKVTSYRNFGFAFGVVLQLTTDIENFLAGFQSHMQLSRDLSHRQLTLPMLYAYDSLTSREDKLKFVELWQQTDQATTQEIVDKALVELLGTQNTLRGSISQTLGVALKQTLEAQAELEKLDPGLDRLEHRLMLTTLKSLFQRLHLPNELNS